MATIFVMENDPIVRNLVARVLEMKGYRVEVFESSPQALEAADFSRADLVLAEVPVPGARDEPMLAVRERGDEVPLVVMARHSDAPRVQGLKALGAQEVLTKPFRMVDLLTVVRRTLSTGLTTSLEYQEVDAGMRARIESDWGATAARQTHLEDGFSLVAADAGAPVGLISVCWRPLSFPASETVEGYIDLIEVQEPFRRRGIGRALIGRATQKARAYGAYQLRAWSSEDKTGALLMWKALRFGLYPAEDGGVRGFFATKVL